MACTCGRPRQNQRCGLDLTNGKAAMQAPAVEENVAGVSRHREDPLTQGDLRTKGGVELADAVVGNATACIHLHVPPPEQAAHQRPVPADNRRDGCVFSCCGQRPTLSFGKCC